MVGTWWIWQTTFSRSTVSIPRTGWGWLGQRLESSGRWRMSVSIPRTGWGWLGLMAVRWGAGCCPFQSLGRVGGGWDTGGRPPYPRRQRFQSLGRVGGGWDLAIQPNSRITTVCFNPSDGLGVVGTPGSRSDSRAISMFQSLGRVGGGWDDWNGQQPIFWNRFQSLGRVGGGWDDCVG